MYVEISRQGKQSASFFEKVFYKCEGEAYLEKIKNLFSVSLNEMLKETEKMPGGGELPEGAKSEFFCMECEETFKISSGFIKELEVVICPRCGSMKILKRRPDTKTIQMAI